MIVLQKKLIYVIRENKIEIEIYNSPFDKSNN